MGVRAGPNFRQPVVCASLDGPAGGQHQAGCCRFAGMVRKFSVRVDDNGRSVRARCAASIRLHGVSTESQRDFYHSDDDLGPGAPVAWVK